MIFLKLYTDHAEVNVLMIRNFVKLELGASVDMKMSKVIKPLIIPVSALLGYAVINVINGKKSSSVFSNIAQTVSNSANNPEKTFAGFKESELNEIAKNTSRGLKAVIVGNVLEYWFKSRSGKQSATAKIELDSAGEPIITFNPYYGTANSPHFFIENLRNVMKKYN